MSMEHFKPQKSTLLILGNEPLNQSSLDKLSEIFNLYKSSESLDKEKVEVIWSDLSVKIDSNLLSSFPNLRLIIQLTTALTNFSQEVLENSSYEIIHLATHKKFLQSITSTAEHAWALMMFANNKLREANNSVLQGAWDRRIISKYQLLNKNVGIIGFGRLGRLIAQYAFAFGMNVFAYDKSVVPRIDSVEFVANIYELLTKSDFVFLTASVESRDNPILGKTELIKMKSDSILINVSRGCLVDQFALVDLLQKRKNFYYATDVLQSEDLKNTVILRNNEIQLIHLDNVYCTPHIGGYSIDARLDCEQHIIDFILKGRCDCESKFN